MSHQDDITTPDFMRLMAQAPAIDLPDHFDPGQHVGGRYRLVKSLGEGGFGQVWSAQHTSGQTVVLKMLRPDRQSDGHQAAFEQELRALARMNHPGVVRLLDEGIDEKTNIRFGVMELLDGEPMHFEGLSLRQMLESFDRLLETLGHIHARGLIHRDLKPENVMLTHPAQDPIPRLLDFGIAHIDERLASALNLKRVEIGREGLPMGTLPYMSPEQASGQHRSIGPTSDIYSLGIMFFEALTGQLPFNGSAVQIIYDHMTRQPPAMGLPAGLEALETLVQDMLAKHPHQRPETAADVRRRLQAILKLTNFDAIEFNTPSPPDAHRDTTRVAQGEHDTATFTPTLDAAPPTVVTLPSPAANIQGPRAATVSQDPPTAATWPGVATKVHFPVPWAIRKLREPPLAGRREQCRALLEAARSVLRRKRTQGTLLLGSDGSGRNHIARWASQQVLAHGLMRVLTLDMDTRTNLDDALRVALLGHLRWPRQEFAEIDRRMTEVFGPAETRRRKAQIKLLLDLSDAPQGHARDETWDQLLRLCTLCPTPRPVLLWVMGGLGEDEALMDRFLGRQLGRQDATMLVVCPLNPLTADLKERASARTLAEHEAITAVQVPALGADSQRKLIAAFEPGLSPSAVELLLQRCEGNPHFIRQTLFAWHAHGLLQPTPEGLYPSDVGWGAFSLQDIERHRLEALLAASQTPDELSHSLKLLAMMGNSFTRQQAQWCLETTDQSPDTLLQGRYLTRHSVARSAHLSFSARLMRSTLETMVRRTGQAHVFAPTCVELRLRQSISTMITSDWEGTYQELRQATRALADCDASVRPGLELQVLDALARTAYRRRDATALRNIILSIRALNAPVNAPITADLWDAMALNLDGQAAAARSALQKVCLQADASTITIHAWHYLGELSLQMNLPRSTQEVLQNALKRATALQTQPHKPYTTRLLNLVCADILRTTAEFHGKKASNGDAQARKQQERLLLQALEICRQEGDLQGESRLYTLLTRMWRQALFWAKDNGQPMDPRMLEHAQRCWARLSALTNAMDDRRGLALLEWEAGGLAELIQDFEAATGHYLKAQAHFEALGERFNAAAALNTLGEVAAQQGLHQQALDHFKAHRETMKQLKDERHEAHALGQMAWMALALHQNTQQQIHLANATHWFAMSIGLLPQRGLDVADRSDLATLRVGLAEALSRQNEWAKAQERLTEAARFNHRKALSEPTALRALERMAHTQAMEAPPALRAELEGLLQTLHGTLKGHQD